jgi:isochorismate synthase
MTDPKDFFSALDDQMEKNFPFVAYKDPASRSGSTKTLLQDYLDVYKTTDFSRSGFLLAPFDDRQEAVIIPQEKSKFLETVFTETEELQLSPGVDYSNSSAVKEKERHIDLVQKGIDAINAGEFQKVVLSRKEVLETGRLDALELFQRLLKKYPNAYVYLFHHPKVGTWLGATPEVLLEVERNRFRTMALAGTQQFTGSMEVEWGAKEKKEQQFVTDAIVESLQKNGSNIQLKGPFTSRAGNLLHLRTDITGEIGNVYAEDASGNEKDPSEEKKNNLTALIRAIHPTPAICGLPREPAKKFILENENYDREFYTGFLGEINMKHEIKRSGNRRNTENQAYAAQVTKTSLYMNLRCMKLTQNTTEIFVGGGITSESVPVAEWEETLNKAGTMKEVLNMQDRKLG